MISVGFFEEMDIAAHNDGKIADFIVDKVNYDKKTVVDYLKSFKHFASCPRDAVDCISGETITPSFKIYKDDEYCWPDSLIYHIEKYNIALPQEFINKIMDITA